MNRFDELQAGHQRLLDQRDAGGDEQALVQAVQAYIEAVKAGAEQVTDTRERGQLKANLRFWGAYIYEKTRVYPDTTLRPATLAPVPPPLPAAAPPPPPPPPTGAAAPAAPSYPPAQAAPPRPPVGMATAPAQPPASPPVWPKEVASEPLPMAGPPRRAWLLTAGAILGALVICIVLVSLLRRPLPTAAPTQAPAAVVTPAPAAATSEPAAEKPTRTPFVTRTPTPFQETVVPTISSATISAFMTEAALGGNTGGNPSSTPTPWLPDSGGGGSMVEAVTYRAQVSAGPPAADCAGSANTLTLDFSGIIREALDFLGPNPGFHMEPFTVEVSQAGSGRPVVPPQTLPWDNRSAQNPVLRLQTGTGEQTLLVQVRQPRLLFDTVIIQFLGGCRRSQVRIAYTRDPNGPDLKMLHVGQGAFVLSPLDVNWTLVTWGPVGVTNSWIARLKPLGVGGDGNYIIYLLEANELIEQGLLVTGAECTPAEQTVVVVSNGQSALRYLSLVAPCDR